MQDFAKTRPVFERRMFQPVGERKLDALSVLFGGLLGAIVMFVGFKASSSQETQLNPKVVSQKTAEEASVPQFEFYEMLKRDDLYPSLTRQVE